MNIFVNKTNELHNLKNNFKLEVRQVIEKIEQLGFSIASYTQAKSYKLNHGYYSVFFNSSDCWLKLDCSNDEQFPIVVSHCLKYDMMFIPITEVLRIKSDSYTKKAIFLAALNCLNSQIDSAIQETLSLENLLSDKSLTKNEAYTLACNCIEYRNDKLKSNRIFSLGYKENAKDFFYSLLINLLSSNSKNSDNGLLSNIRQIANITKKVRQEFTDLFQEVKA